MVVVGDDDVRPAIHRAFKMRLSSGSAATAQIALCGR